MTSSTITTKSWLPPPSLPNHMVMPLIGTVQISKKFWRGFFCTFILLILPMVSSGSEIVVEAGEKLCSEKYYGEDPYGKKSGPHMDILNVLSDDVVWSPYEGLDVRAEWKNSKVEDVQKAELWESGAFRKSRPRKEIMIRFSAHPLDRDFVVFQEVYPKQLGGWRFDGDDDPIGEYWNAHAWHRCTKEDLDFFLILQP